MQDEPYTQAIIDARLYSKWSPDLRAALDGKYGAFSWDGNHSPEFRAFVEEHARDWLKMLIDAGRQEITTYVYRPMKLGGEEWKKEFLY